MEKQEVALAVEKKKRVKRPKGHGSFWVRRGILELLLTDDVPVVNILAYLIFARYTQKDGMFSSAGHTAIGRKIGLGPGQVTEVMLWLKDIGLLVSSKDWEEQAYYHNMGSEEKMKTFTKRPGGFKAQVRWVLDENNMSSSNAVWFHNDLIDGTDANKYPLKALMRYSDNKLIVKLFLSLHCGYDVSLEAVRPFQNMYVSYLNEHIASYPDYLVFNGTEEMVRYGKSLLENTFDINTHAMTKEQIIKSLVPLNDALIFLEYHDFVYRIVAVFNKKPYSNDAQILYELDIKNEHGHHRTEKQIMLAAKIQDALKKAGVTPRRNDDRFYREYYAICPVGMEAHVVGLFRPVYAVRNMKNTPVELARLDRSYDRTEAAGWVKDFTGKYSHSVDGV